MLKLEKNHAHTFLLFFLIFISSNDAETEKWRNMYEELFAKVQPFQVSFAFDCLIIGPQIPLER